MLDLLYIINNITIMIEYIKNLFKKETGLPDVVTEDWRDVNMMDLEKIFPSSILIEDVENIEDEYAIYDGKDEDIKLEIKYANKRENCFNGGFNYYYKRCIYFKEENKYKRIAPNFNCNIEDFMTWVVIGDSEFYNIKNLTDGIICVYDVFDDKYTLKRIKLITSDAYVYQNFKNKIIK